MTTVLVVDDEDALVELLHIVLTDAGYRVVTAHNGQEALAVVAREVPAVIISDVMMPVMDGYMLLRTVRQQGLAVLVIFVSAYRLDRTRVPQPDAYVAKPYDLDAIEALVAQLSAH